VYCPNCGKIIAESAKFCSSCGIMLTGEPNKTSMENDLIQRKSEKGIGFHCPSCESQNLNMVSSAGKYIWVCNQCGEKFQDLDQLKKYIELQEKMLKIYIFLGILGAIAGIMLYRGGNAVGFQEIKVLGIIEAVFALVTFGYLTGRMYTILPKKKQEYDELEKKVKD